MSVNFLQKIINYLVTVRVPRNEKPATGRIIAVYKLPLQSMQLGLGLGLKTKVFGLGLGLATKKTARASGERCKLPQWGL